jgi:hypothetical protein
MEFLLLYFLISAFLTFVYLYMTSEKAQPILKYPNHTKKISKLYTDDKNVCYRYHTKEVDCKKYNIQ